MIWYGLFAAAFFAFLRQLWVLKEYGKYESRRHLSGCEIARQILDQTGFSQVSVQSYKGWLPAPSGVNKQFFLEQSIYDGQSLYAAALTAREAVRLKRSAGSALSEDWLRRVRKFLPALIVPGWIFFLFGEWLPQGSLFSAGGGLVLQAALLLGVFELSQDWEISREAGDILRQTENFEPDEIVKIKFLLSALKWQGLAEVFNVPLALSKKIFRLK